ncbi:MAG: hypothetical protein ACWGNB_04445 [Thiogranum sp.]
MERSPVVLIVCCLGLLPGTLFMSPEAGAIATNPSPLIAGTEPLPDFSGVARVPRPAEPPAEETPVADAAPGTDAAPAVAATTAAPPDSGPAAEIPCLSSFLSDDSQDDAANQSCDDPSDAQQRLSLKFGRRMGVGSGILGEFDGVRVDYRLTGGLTLNGVAGYPVLSDKDKFNVARQVFGFSADIPRFVRAWDLNSYLIEQQSNGKATSRTVGGAVRYLRPKRSLLLLLDYDVVQHSLGAFTAAGAWKLPYQTTISATVDVRNNPIHTRQKKYLQRSMAATEGWTWILPTDRIRHFTSDQSEGVTTLALGLTHAFSRRLKMTGSAAVLDASNQTDSAATAEPASEYLYHLNLTGNDLMFSGDRNTLDFSHRVTDYSRVSSAAIDTRYAINRRWNVSPRLRADYRDNALDQTAQWVTSPSVKMEYRWRDQYGFKIEAGGEWRTREIPTEDKTQSSYFVSLGYKAKF